MVGARYTQCDDSTTFTVGAPVKPGVMAAGGALEGGSIGIVTLLVLVLLAIAGVAVAAVFWPIVIGVALVAAVYGAIDAGADQWLNHRLLCVERRTCALGNVICFDRSPSPDSMRPLLETSFGDNDFTLNILLTPHQPDDPKMGADLGGVLDDGMQGQHLLSKHYTEMPYTGYTHNDCTGYRDTAGERWSLHCEFEGGFMAALRKAARVAEIFSIATIIVAAAVCVATGIFWLLCLLIIILILAAIAGIAYLAAKAAGDDGSPADAAIDPNSGVLKCNDCIIVFGDLVYDAGHPCGWHEIHPVLQVQKLWPVAEDLHLTKEERQFFLDLWKGKITPPVLNDFMNRWCLLLSQGLSVLPLSGEGLKPKDRWCLHPEVDGCSIEVPKPPPIR
jgi:hypothetical protein